MNESETTEGRSSVEFTEKGPGLDTPTSTVGHGTLKKSRTSNLIKSTRNLFFMAKVRPHEALL
jgi:hypothetical protein